MRRVIVSDFLTLDGVIEAPGREEHRDGRNAWALRVTTDEMERLNQEQLLSADALLLGRKTYQLWAAYWPALRDSGPFGSRMNAMTKYVVSNTLKRVEWVNSRLISGDVATAVRSLKQEPGGDILCFGSSQLVETLMRHDLVDQYRLMVFPVILGSGQRLFREDIDLQHLRLLEARTFSSGVVLLKYERQHDEPTSHYVDAYAWNDEQIRSLHAAQNTDRVLATVLFTDIVDSTRRAADMGDRAWRRLLDRHDEIARLEVGRWHGRFMKSTGDGILATFDAPTRALHCAFALRDTLETLGLEIRAGIHTGEIEIRDADVGGIGVHIASRALATAADRQVVVTRTVRDLATGTDLRFVPLGATGLRGVPGSWELFEAALG